MRSIPTSSRMERTLCSIRRSPKRVSRQWLARCLPLRFNRVLNNDIFQWPAKPGMFGSVLLGFVCLMLTACNDTGPLVVAYHPFPGYAPAYVAETMAYWPKGKIKVNRTSNASESARLLASGQADAAFLTLDEAMRLGGTGEDLRVVLIADESVGADTILTREPLNNLHELQGLRIGHEKDAASELLLKYALNTAGLGYKDISPVHLTHDQQEAAWVSGELDALVTYEPLTSRLVERGAHRLYDTRHTPGLILDVLVVRVDAIEKQPSVIETLARGWFQAKAHIEHNPVDTRWRLSGWLKLQPAKVYMQFSGLQLFDIQGNRQWLNGDQQLNASMQRVQQILTTIPESPSRVAPMSTLMADNRFLPPMGNTPGGWQ